MRDAPGTSGGGATEIDIVTGIFPALALGLVCAYLGHRLRLPAGTLTGALAGVGGALTLQGFPEVPALPAADLLLQILIGILVGLRITPHSLRSGARSLVPAAALALAFVGLGAGTALAAVYLTGIDLPTALFSAAPGGLTEMASIGATMGADGPAVAAVHLARLLVVIAAVNLLVAGLQRRAGNHRAPGAQEEAAGGTARLWLVVLAGLAGGLAGSLTPLPAGGVVGALLGAAAVRLLSDGPVPERRFGLGVQAFVGAVLGLGVSEEFFEALASLAGAAALFTAAQMLLWLLASYLLHRLAGYSTQTATFAAAPGGMITLISAASENEADMVTVASIHLVRLTATIVAVPLLVALATSP
ncbi:MAG: AbrB family transcriptional regulator [Rubrobacter sp.]|nr:AbrB family transcriptional regulator [Rubrobacter sp.]